MWGGCGLLQCTPTTLAPNLNKYSRPNLHNLNSLHRCSQWPHTLPRVSSHSNGSPYSFPPHLDLRFNPRSTQRAGLPAPGVLWGLGPVPTGAPVYPLHQSCSGLLWGCSGAALGFKQKDYKDGLQIYRFERESGGRGGCGRAPSNQVIAGILC